MSDTQIQNEQLATEGGGADVAAPPVAPAKSKKEINQERLTKLKEAKERKAGEKAAEKAAAASGEKPAKVKKAKAEKTVRACRCGCGGQTTAYFVPGHDARWKGWMKKIELGKMEPKGLPATTQKMYSFVPRGIGFVPTQNYNEGVYTPQVALEDVTEAASEKPKVKKAATAAAKSE